MALPFSPRLRIFLDAGVAFNDYVKGQPRMTYGDGGFGLDFEIGGHLSDDLFGAGPIDPNSTTLAVGDPRLFIFAMTATFEIFSRRPASVAISGNQTAFRALVENASSSCWNSS
ncbi:hypothetical protein [Rhizobium straminoryzae]|uniref:Uncharacterized protein n=1 Tax=Rhizobium straminoryzae TaxID=1387186 RepID=A0A549T7U8_9HYPH|nr:hypothetical protein [Rhizobium straminoryzae]TRL37920.1 hypothetical protein FNA46_14205 [Rhizobium straminoryzae]